MNIVQVRMLINIDGNLNTVLNSYKKSGQKIPEAEIIKYLVEILKAVDYLHSNKMVHTNLKPSNILIDKKKRAKVEYLMKLEKYKDYEYTYFYLSPESFEKDYFTEATDICAIGCIIYELCYFDVISFI